LILLVEPQNIARYKVRLDRALVQLGDRYARMRAFARKGLKRVKAFLDVAYLGAQ
jgi:hypothetical protein